jgi:hypothetical protein
MEQEIEIKGPEETLSRGRHVYVEKKAAGAKHRGSSLTNHRSSRWSSQRPNLDNLQKIHAVFDKQGRSTPSPRTFPANPREASCLSQNVITGSISYLLS